MLNASGHEILKAHKIAQSFNKKVNYTPREKDKNLSSYLPEPEEVQRNLHVLQHVEPHTAFLSGLKQKRRAVSGISLRKRILED